VRITFARIRREQKRQAQRRLQQKTIAKVTVRLVPTVSDAPVSALTESVPSRRETAQTIARVQNCSTEIKDGPLLTQMSTARKS
jgi:hypothetical protein